MVSIITEKEIKIPYNKLEFFKINKSIKWNSSIEIEFNPYKGIIIENLYNILLSYLNNNIFKPIAIAIAWKDVENNLIIMDNFKPNIIKNMNLLIFEDWFLNRLNYDKKYDPTKKFEYTIIITFGYKFIEEYNTKNNIDILNNLKPNYPWKKNKYIYYLKKEILKNPKTRYLFKKIKNYF